jgi:t-SNARE complex subunit (syntaxin)
LVLGPVADLVFSTTRKAVQDAIRRKLTKKRLDFQLTIAKDGITVTRMERKRKARRVKLWQKPEAQQKEIEEGPSWRVTKCDSL